MKTKDPKRRSIGVPAEPYLVKWLTNYRKYAQPDVWVSADFAFDRKVSPETVSKHYAKTGMMRIKAHMRCPSRLKAYQLYRQLKALFDQDMLAYALASKKAGAPVWPSIEEFLERCQITEHELKLESAYKKWQRAAEKRLPGIKPYEKD